MDNKLHYSYSDIRNITILLIAICLLSGCIYWKFVQMNLVGSEIQNGVGWISLLSPFCLLGLYKLREIEKEVSWAIGPGIACCMGIFLGTVTAFFNEGSKGLITQALLTTFISSFLVLFLYKNKFIVVNNKFVNFAIFVFFALLIIGLADAILSWVVLGWRSLFLGTSIVAISLNAGIIFLAYLIFAIELNVIEEKISEGKVSQNEAWYLSTNLLMCLGWIYLSIVFLILRIKGRGGK